MVELLTDGRLLETLAQVLAAHALWLLGLGVAAAVASVVAIIVAIRLLGRLLECASKYLRGRLLTPSSRHLTSIAYLTVSLALGLAFTAAATVFVVVAEEVVTAGDMASFDVLFARALRTTVTPSWERFFSGVSRTGSPDVLVVATLVVAVALLVKHQSAMAAGWLFAQAGSGLLILVLKTTFARARPESAGAWFEATWSFPSGHAMGTFVFLGVGCYVLLRQVRSWTLATAAVTLSVVWCLLISFSRLYLGVHFASDVVAGAFAGAAWVAACVVGFELTRGGVTRTAVRGDRQRGDPDVRRLGWPSSRRVVPH